jgi:hypothetical protein
MTACLADPIITPPGAGSAATVDHSHDYDPDVVVTAPLGGLSVWQCRCGTSSLGSYADPGNARAGFLAHKYGLPWPSATRPAAPVARARRPRAHRVVNGLVFGGGAGMILLSVVPPLSALCLLIALAGLVAMAVQYPSRQREHRRRRNRRTGR